MLNSSFNQNFVKSQYILRAIPSPITDLQVQLEDEVDQLQLLFGESYLEKESSLNMLITDVSGDNDDPIHPLDIGESIRIWSVLLVVWPDTYCFPLTFILCLPGLLKNLWEKEKGTGDSVPLVLFLV